MVFLRKNESRPGLARTRVVQSCDAWLKPICRSPESDFLPVQDPYANYVLQSALSVSSGALHMDLVDAMRPYLPSLRGTPHGKRILSKINVKI